MSSSSPTSYTALDSVHTSEHRVFTTADCNSSCSSSGSGTRLSASTTVDTTHSDSNHEIGVSLQGLAEIVSNGAIVRQEQPPTTALDEQEQAKETESHDATPATPATPASTANAAEHEPKVSYQEILRLQQEAKLHHSRQAVFPLLHKVWHSWKNRHSSRNNSLALRLDEMNSGTHAQMNLMKPRIAKFERFEREEKAAQDQMLDAARFYYATDMSFVRDITPDELFLGIKRRCAWTQNPTRMFLITFAQIAMCVLVLLTPNEPINASTMFTALLYILAMATTIDYVVTKELRDSVVDHSVKAMDTVRNAIGEWALVPARIFAICLLPLLLLPLLVTFCMDFFIGKMHVLHFSDVVNTTVDFIVIFSGFSVGLRSGTPVNAIQTFAAFECIRLMDEVIIDTYELDLSAETAPVDTNKTKTFNNLMVRIAVYVIIFVLLVLFLYVTAANPCLAFCDA
jgi:preprotein translocase subunit SecG